MKKPKQPELLPEPLPFDSPDFAEAWHNWESFRVEIKEPLTPTARRIQFKKLKAWGQACAIESIEQSINSGWRGLFEPKGGNGVERLPERSDDGPPCQDWRERAQRLRRRPFTLSWATHCRTDVHLRRDLVEDLGGVQ